MGVSKEDKEEFIERVFEELYGNLKSFLYYYSFDKEVVEDILQETYLAAYNHAEELIGNPKYKSWMYATAVNKAKKINEMNKRHNECLSLENQNGLYVENESELVRFSTINSILEVDESNLLMLHYCDRYTYDELAEMFNKTPSYIKMRISRIVKKVRKKSKDFDL